MMRKLPTRLGLKTEDFHRQSTHRACHPVTIKIEIRPLGSPNIGSDIHFHAVDNGQKIRLLKTIIPHRLGEVAGAHRKAAEVESVDVNTPCREFGEPPFSRLRRIRYIVDLATEAIDRKHCVALRLGQNPHRQIERAARCATGVGGAIGLYHAGTHASFDLRKANLPRTRRVSNPVATPASVPPITPILVKCTFSLNGSRVLISPNIRRARVVMTATSRDSRKSSIIAAKPRLSCSNASVRCARVFTHRSNAGDDCAAPSSSIVAPAAAKASFAGQVERGSPCTSSTKRPTGIAE